MPRKKDPNAPKKVAKPRKPKAIPMPASAAPADDAGAGDPLPEAPAVKAVPAVEVSASGSLADLKPAPPAKAPAFGIGARRG